MISCFPSQVKIASTHKGEASFLSNVCQAVYRKLSSIDWCSKDRSRVQGSPIDFNMMDSSSQQPHVNGADTSRVGSDVLPWMMDQNSVSGLGLTSARSSLTE